MTQDGANPEIGHTLQTGQVTTNFHDIGSGPPVLLLHGSGPGVSSWANWRLTIPALERDFRCLAPDLAGFGYSTVPEGWNFSRETWLQQLIDFLDALEIDRVHVIGNSFGGSMALALALACPDRIDRLVLMGSVGVEFPITHGLDLVWGYAPSQDPTMDGMREVMKVFAYDQSLIGEDLVEMRYRASSRPQAAQSYEAMFPAPRQRWVDALAFSHTEIKSLNHEVLIVHGRDDQVIPSSNSLQLLELLDNSRLCMFAGCGHWTQIEKKAEFNQLAGAFLKGAGQGEK